MPYQRPFPYIKKFLLGRQTYVLYAVFCMLLCITPPCLAASGGWAATYGGADNDCADSIQQTRDGGYIVAGRTKSFGAGDEDAWVLKLRPDGTVEWQKTYGGDKDDGACSILQTSDGGYVVAGWTESFGAGKTDAWVLKLGPDGTIEWQKAYVGVDCDGAISIQQTTDGGYMVAGYTTSFGAGAPDLLVMKLDAYGSINPSCAFIVVDTYSSEINSDAKVLDTHACARDSNINPRDSWAVAQDTKASANILCP